MNRFFIFLTYLCVLTIVPGYATPPIIEVKAGYLIFASQKMRDVYHCGGPEIQLTGAYPIKENLEIYGNIGFLQAWGKSLHLHERTIFWRIPVDLGLRPVFNLTSFMQWYAALGPRYFYAHQHNISSFVNRKIGKSGIGAFANTGFSFFPSSHFLIDIFGEYSYEPLHFSSSKTNVSTRTLQVGGFYFGVGFGYAF